LVLYQGNTEGETNVNLGDFHDLVKDIFNRGTKLDAVIPTFTRQAARWLERNYTFQYMHTLEPFVVDPDGTTPRLVTLPNEPKELRFVRFVLQPSTVYNSTSVVKFAYLRQIDPSESYGRAVEIPTEFWMNGTRELEMVSMTDEDVDLGLEVDAYWYTNWPDDAAEEPWLILNGEDVMMAATCIVLAAYDKNSDMMVRFQPIFDKSIKTLIDSGDILVQSARDEEMLYDGYRV
jgi:hypothetical protein